MKSSAKKVELASVDDLFSTEESRADAQRSQQIKIKRYAHVVEGHILDFKPRKKRRHP